MVDVVNSNSINELVPELYPFRLDDELTVTSELRNLGKCDGIGLYSAVLSAYQYGLPLQSGDVAVRVREWMDGYSRRRETPDLDYSDLPQITSDVGSVSVSSDHKRLTLQIANLSSICDGDFKSQARLARRIGWGTKVKDNDLLAIKIQEHAGERCVDLPVDSSSQGESYFWPLFVPINDCSDKNGIVKAFFPKNANLNLSYLHQHRFSEGRFFVIPPADLFSLLNVNPNERRVLVAPVSLGGRGIIPGLETRDHVVVGYPGDMYKELYFRLFNQDDNHTQ
ncbi:MAG: hypothetical protein AABX47_10345 [Nanoarchaeota archaeon]